MNNISTNMHYDFILEASHFNSVIRRLKLQPKPTDEVEALVHDAMIKKLTSVRDSLWSQGVSNMKDGQSIIGELDDKTGSE